MTESNGKEAKFDVRLGSRVLVAVAVSFLLFACGKSDKDLKSQVDQLIDPAANQQIQSVQQNYQALVVLDQEYPDRLVLKATIGQIQLQNGNLDLAGAFLKRGLKLIGPFTDSDLKYRLYHALAVLSLMKGEHDQAISYANEAKGLREDGDIAVALIQARAKVELKRNDEAIVDYASVYEKNRDAFGLEDFTKYIQALVNDEKYSEALVVFSERQRRFGYSLGQGMDESALQEKAGNLGDSVLGAFAEFEIRRASFGLDAAAINTNLVAIGERLEKSGLDTDGRAAAVIVGLRAFAEGKWSAVIEAFKDKDLIKTHPVLAYVVLASKLRTPDAAEGDLQAYNALEPFFRSVQPYYDHLWRAWKARKTGYSVASVKPVLEKTISIDPRTGLAAEARIELAQLLGLRSEDGSRLLLESEQVMLVNALAQNNDPAALGPLCDLLTLPDNSYGISATNYLREAVKSPRVRALVEDRRKTAEGRLKERLTGILGG